MKYLVRRYLLIFAVLVALPVVASAFVAQQDQIAVTIVVNVTPAPVALVPQGAKLDGAGIVAALSIRGHRIFEKEFSGEALHFTPDMVALAVPTAQGAVKVEAEVSPNPKATELYSDQNVVTINGTAGTSVVVPCAYHVIISTTKTYWQLEHGLSNDFAGSFPGTDLANNTHVAAPNATATPFVVYPNNGNKWALIATSAGGKTYCVDLTLTIPLGVAQGAYSSNAVYTLFY
ncbi:MAG: hypothetical protein M3N13_01390 [Candidatus Eremiobacteraeota bacterium]|nr:hypothetical protein [Candidatus Eremiobacteraeota bacterium]